MAALANKLFLLADTSGSTTTADNTDNDDTDTADSDDSTQIDTSNHGRATSVLILAIRGQNRLANARLCLPQPSSSPHPLRHA
ncbi:MAG: hypothetical protein GY782_11225 [Gammaproteobacteria bacterium]|nr:hypothetical protein [Gammaproteobacteria bacterium]